MRPHPVTPLSLASCLPKPLEARLGICSLGGFLQGQLASGNTPGVGDSDTVRTNCSSLGDLSQISSRRVVKGKIVGFRFCHWEEKKFSDGGF